jgi:hypothetical protein
MRKAGNDYGLITNNNIFIGVALGYDYCAEHECGINDLKNLCGIPKSSKDNMGIKNRQITVVPPLVFKKDGEYAYLYTGSKYYSKEENERDIPREIRDYKNDFDWIIKQAKTHPERNDELIITAWDGGSFGIAIMGEKEVEYLEELHQAFLNKNIAIAVTNLRSKNPFSGSSLCILITDRIPEETINSMYYADKKYYDLLDYEEKICMKDIIKTYGNKNGYMGDKYFMACSPKWIDYDDPVKREEIKKHLNTIYDIRYWVNYSDNDDNFGWYSVEEIEKWMTTPKLHLKDVKINK